eukprot:CAMPEP_0116833406 /NCGR_PEP_ID=MMETSP0418-20121206/6418_1 /TAXON_ID=1158023 /ORGANISM="Astrosyne radiata, Strain 13vi08-1A" /LENGTH=356 /DNA_ID=CAMNT_0004462851 /DNA_START=32 /DNA_END=1102 /DNA_ORIENTATION=-
MKSSVAAVVPLFLIFIQESSGSMTCGDCWCTFNPTGTNDSATCPPRPDGIIERLPSASVVAYKSFVEESPLDLATPGGDKNCYPFRDRMGTTPNFPESELPQCQLPTGPSTAVCAYKYSDPSTTTNGGVECTGRSYRVVQYDTVDDAVQEGASVIHKGKCGVCSNANDVGLRGSEIDFQQEILLCSLDYSLSGSNPNRFQALIDCMSDPTKSIGFSEPCARLWAHYSALNFFLCSEPCASGLTGTISFNGPPPKCEPSDCRQCTIDLIQDIFDDLSGFTMNGAGFLEDIVYPCDEYYPIFHDPCIGAHSDGPADPNGGGATNNPTPAPTPTSSAVSPSRAVLTTTALFVSLGFLVQ